MKTPTIYEIKNSIINAPYYFDRKTMKSFGQTLKDFHVNKTNTEGVFYIWAQGKNSLSERFYNAKTQKLYHEYETAKKGE